MSYLIITFEEGTMFHDFDQEEKKKFKSQIKKISIVLAKSLLKKMVCFRETFSRVKLCQ